MARSSCESPFERRQLGNDIAQGFLIRNFESRRHPKEVSFRGGDGRSSQSHLSAVDWYLQEWMRFRGKRQADLVKDLGWAKGRANKFFHGQHPYRREIINELSPWLEIEPFEILLPPEEAMRIRRLREAVAEAAAMPAAVERGRRLTAEAEIPKGP